MASGKIGKRTVEALQSEGRVTFLWDDELRGFGLRVTPAGAKSYVFQYRMGGRETAARRYTIGSHGSPWTPVLARAEAQRLAVLVAQGVDPAEADRERRRQSVDLAFREYVEEFSQRYLRAKWKRWEKARAMLVQHAVPVLGRRPLPTIKRADLNSIWDALADRPATAKLMHSTMRKLFRWAVERGDIERSPLEGVAGPSPVASRDRVLSDRELRLCWTAAADLGLPFRALYRLLILTGQRRDEVAGMEWAELNRDQREWSLPGNRTKNGEASIVPLAEPTVVELDLMAGGSRWPRRGLVFTTTGNSPVSGFAKGKKRLDAAIAVAERAAAAREQREPEIIAPWRIHDLRRTLATGLQQLGVRFEVTEAVLNHVSGARSGVAGVYQRHTWAAEKRTALAAWADKVSVDPA